jgi:hypothetical protein
MQTFISYFSAIALFLVIVLLVWSLMLMVKADKKIPLRNRLKKLKTKVESLPETTPEEKANKDAYYRELSVEYLDAILSEIGNLKQKETKKIRKKKKAV